MGTPWVVRWHYGVRRGMLAGAILVLAAVAGFAVPAAHAHAIVTKTTLEEQPIRANTATPVTLYFNSRIEPSFTRVLLVDPAKKERPLEVTPGEKGDTVTVQLPALAAGAYTLRYKVLAIDGHVTEGVLRFRVRSAE